MCVSSGLGEGMAEWHAEIGQLLQCPICLLALRGPVVADCGHAFCFEHGNAHPVSVGCRRFELGQVSCFDWHAQLTHLTGTPN